MVSSVNPTGVVYTISLSNNSVRSSTLTKALASNKNPEVSVVRSAQGSRTAAAAKTGTNILQNMGTGYGIVNTATELLKNLREQLEDIKGDILSLENASPQILDVAEANYTNQVGRIFDILTNTNFAGKNLFDGTLANAPTIRLPAQSLPENAASLRVQIGIDSDSHIDITIPRMLSGNGTILNVPVNGVFDPLFPVTDNAIAALTKLNAVANTAIVGVGAIAGQRALIDAAIPAGVNAEQDIIRNVALVRYDLLNDGALPDAQANANLILMAAKAVGGAATLSQNNEEDIRAAINNVSNIMLAAYAGLADNAAAIAVINAIPSDVTVSYAQQLIKTVALVAATREMIINAGGDDNASAINILQNADAAIVLNPGTFTKEMLDRPFPNPIYTGSVKTLSGRVGAMQIVDNALRSIDTATAQLNSQKSALNSAKATLDVLVTELSAAADNYLSADYEKIIPELTQLLREAKVLSLAFGLSERQINTVISQMENAAAAA